MTLFGITHCIMWEKLITLKNPCVFNVGSHVFNVGSHVRNSLFLMWDPTLEAPCVPQLVFNVGSHVRNSLWSSNVGAIIELVLTCCSSSSRSEAHLLFLLNWQSAYCGSCCLASLRTFCFLGVGPWKNQDFITQMDPISNIFY